MRALKGIHHVTAITGDAQKNVDFYAGVLGLRLVKKTVNFDDPGTYHLYFGDHSGVPGTLVTFFAWPGAARGQIGASEPVAVTFEVPKGTLEWWAGHLKAQRNGERLTVFDPDGMRVDLVEGGAEAEAPGIRRIHGVTLNLRDPERSGAIFTGELGFRKIGEGRYQAGDGLVDVQQGEGGHGRMGAGTIHHVAFRTDDDESQLEWRQHIDRLGMHVSPVMDRKYFHSIYFREPSGVLFEIATDPPGMTIDEPAEHLGETLALPAEYESVRKQLEATLVPLRVPAAEARA